jgi:hypothetical protein
MKGEGDHNSLERECHLKDSILLDVVVCKSDN